MLFKKFSLRLWIPNKDAIEIIVIRFCVGNFLEMAPKNKIDESEKKPLIGRVGTNLRVGIVGEIKFWIVHMFLGSYHIVQVIDRFYF